MWKRLIIFPGNYGFNKAAARRFWTFWAVIFGLALIVSPNLRYYLRSLLEYPLHYKEYKEFGIRIPSGFDVHGVDVSKWQRRVNWEKVQKMSVSDINIQFAFIKATEGSWLKDPEFERNWENAKRNNIIRGAYHFYLPNINSKDQAKHFMNTVKLKPGDLPPVVDVEETRGMSKALVAQGAKNFMDILERYYKVKPILYTNVDFYKQYFYGNKEFDDYKLWLAHYHVNRVDPPGDTKWAFWQHSDRGNVNGINEPVDFNVFNGSLEDLKRMCVK